MFSKYDFMDYKALKKEMKKRGLPVKYIKTGVHLRVILMADDEKKLSEFIGEDGLATEILPGETTGSQSRVGEEKS